MAEVKKATPDDFERVYPLLLDFHTIRLTKDDWRRIFSPPWAVEEDYCGYMLDDGVNVVGYLGYVFSRQSFDNGDIKVCNLTTWIVKEEHRGQSLDLFYPAMKLDDYLITDFSPTPSVIRMFEKRFKYRVLETGLYFAYPMPGVSIGGSCRVSFDDSIDADKLSPNDRRIHEDHRTLAVRRILVESATGNTYMVARHRRFRKIRHLEVLYISDSRVLASCAGPALRAMCRKYLVFGLKIEERLLDGVRLPLSYRRLPLVTTLYKTSLTVEPRQITHLYSEKVLL